MKRSKGIARLAAITLAGFVTSAAATESGWYVGVAANDAKFDLRDGSFNLGIVYPRQVDTDSARGGTLTVGFRFNRYVGAEAGYVDFGETEFVRSGLLYSTSAGGVAARGTSSVKFGVKGATLAVSGSLPLRNWELFAKGGVLFASNEVIAKADYVVTRYFTPPLEQHTSTQRTSRGEEILFSAGAGYTISDHYHLKADWTSISNIGDEDTPNAKLSVASLGFQYRF